MRDAHEEARIGAAGEGDENLAHPDE